jgi:hypothetical protein
LSSVSCRQSVARGIFRANKMRESLLTAAPAVSQAREYKEKDGGTSLKKRPRQPPIGF